MASRLLIPRNFDSDMNRFVRELEKEFDNIPESGGGTGTDVRLPEPNQADTLLGVGDNVDDGYQLFSRADVNLAHNKVELKYDFTSGTNTVTITVFSNLIPTLSIPVGGSQSLFVNFQDPSRLTGNITEVGISQIATATQWRNASVGTIFTTDTSPGVRIEWRKTATGIESRIVNTGSGPVTGTNIDIEIEYMQTVDVNTNFGNVVELDDNLTVPGDSTAIYRFSYKNGNIFEGNVEFDLVDFNELTAVTEGTSASSLNDSNSFQFRIANSVDYVVICRKSDNSIMAGIVNWTSSKYPRPEFRIDETNVVGNAVNIGSGAVPVSWARQNNTDQIPANKLRNAPARRTDNEINTLIDNRIPASRRVLTGGTNGQIYSRTSSGYAWINPPSGGGGGGSSTITDAVTLSFRNDIILGSSNNNLLNKYVIADNTSNLVEKITFPDTYGSNGDIMYVAPHYENSIMINAWIGNRQYDESVRPRETAILHKLGGKWRILSILDRTR